MLVQTETGEVDVDLDANEEGVKAHYEAKGYVLRPKSEIESEKEALKSETTTRVANEIHSTWEKQIGAALGEDRPAGVKGLDWAKEKVTETAKKAKEKPADPPKTVSDDVRNAEFATMKKELEDFKKAQETEKAASAEKVVNSSVRSSLRALQVAGETEVEQGKMRSSLEALVRSRYTWKIDESNDELVAYEGGNVVMDSATQKPKVFNKIVEEEFGFMLKKAEPTPTNPKTSGTGTGQGDVSDKGKVDLVGGVKAATEAEIRQIARENGLVAGSKALLDFMDKSLKLSGLKK